jgi:hypothetical protein
MADEDVQRTVEQVFAAVRALALGQGGLRERLENASNAILAVESHTIPEALREEFRALLADVMAVDDFDALSDSAASSLALRILVFHERVLLSA